MTERTWVAQGELTLPVFGEQYTTIGGQYLDMLLRAFEYENVRVTVTVEPIEK